MKETEIERNEWNKNTHASDMWCDGILYATATNHNINGVAEAGVK